MLLLAPGVLAVGVGERTTPGGAERLARRVFAAGLAHTILVVPIAQQRATMHLDTVCTMVDVDAVVMYPKVADTLRAWTVTAPEGVADDGDPVELRVAARARSSRRPPRRWASTGCGSSTPAWTRSPPNASSGTTATTPWPSRPGCAWPTSGTSRPTPRWSGPASR